MTPAEWQRVERQLADIHGVLATWETMTDAERGQMPESVWASIDDLRATLDELGYPQRGRDLVAKAKAVLTHPSTKGQR